MERAHYRQYTPSRMNGYSEPPPEEPSGFQEKLIVQGIICGILLAVVLALGFTESTWTLGVKTSLQQAITDNITAEQVAEEVRRVLGSETQLAGVAVHTEEVYEAHETTGRIDEDVLREIIGFTEDSEGDSLQTTAPEPIILPEL